MNLFLPAQPQKIGEGGGSLEERVGFFKKLMHIIIPVNKNTF